MKKNPRFLSADQNLVYIIKTEVHFGTVWKHG